MSVGSPGLVTIFLLKLKMQMFAGCEHAGSCWKEWADSVCSFFWFKIPNYCTCMRKNTLEFCLPLWAATTSPFPFQMFISFVYLFSSLSQDTWLSPEQILPAKDLHCVRTYSSSQNNNLCNNFCIMKTGQLLGVGKNQSTHLLFAL